MAVHTQFSIAVHIMAALAYSSDKQITSTMLAGSVNTSPSFVRRVVAKLSKAGLVRTATGKSGACRLARDASRISLFEIYEAVDAPRAFAIHQYPELKRCPVSCEIKRSLDKVLSRTQEAMEKSLKSVNLEQILGDMRRK